MGDLKINYIETADKNIYCLRKSMTLPEITGNYELLFEKIGFNQLSVIGVPLLLWYDSEINPNGNDIELGVPILEKVEGARILEGKLCATFRHVGAYEELPLIYEKAVKLIEEQGYKISMPIYEEYHNDVRYTPSEELITEIFIPVSKS